MTIAPGRRSELIDVRECRATERFDLRAGTSSNTLTLTGYASTFEPYEMYGGPSNYGWIEQLAPTAFDKTLREKPDLHLLINHQGMPLARTKSGTLQLDIDNIGLKVVAQLDRDDPDVQRLESKMRRRDLDEMSFAFRVKGQTWSVAPGFDDPQSLRTINEVSLHKGDVSVVNFGANPATTAELLGRRTKTESGMKKTLSRAEALAIVEADERRMPRSRPSTGAGRTHSAAQRQIDAEAAARRAYAASSDDVLVRAAELLQACGVNKSDESAVARLVRTHTAPPGYAPMILPPAGELLKADAEDGLRRRRDAQVAELDRQRDAITNPPTARWPYGPDGAYSIALK